MVATALLFATSISVLVLYEKKRWSPVLLLVVLSVSGFAISAGSGWLIDPETPFGPIVWRLISVTVSGLAVIGITGLVHKARVRAGKPSGPPPSPVAGDQFSVARVFKAYLVILTAGVVVFAVWLWWLVQSV